MCDHFHESTSRYDHSAKVLTLLLVCPVCRIERVVETIDYEPRFKPCLSLIVSRERTSFADIATTGPEPEPLRIAA
jgi:hypothetical protein